VCGGWLVVLALLSIRRGLRAEEKPLNQQILRLPIRLCEDCPGQPNALENYLCRVPIYERLLALHPDAQTSLCE
jgi:hypothetical protein